MLLCVAIFSSLLGCHSLACVCPFFFATLGCSPAFALFQQRYRLAPMVMVGQYYFINMSSNMLASM